MFRALNNAIDAAGNLALASVQQIGDEALAEIERLGDGVLALIELKRKEVEKAAALAAKKLEEFKETIREQPAKIPEASFIALASLVPATILNPLALSTPVNDSNTDLISKLILQENYTARSVKLLVDKFTDAQLWETYKRNYRQLQNQSKFHEVMLVIIPRLFLNEENLKENDHFHLLLILKYLLYKGENQLCKSTLEIFKTFNVVLHNSDFLKLSMDKCSEEVVIKIIALMDIKIFQSNKLSDSYLNIFYGGFDLLRSWAGTLIDLNVLYQLIELNYPQAFNAVLENVNSANFNNWLIQIQSTQSHGLNPSNFIALCEKLANHQSNNLLKLAQKTNYTTLIKNYKHVPEAAARKILTVIKYHNLQENAQRHYGNQEQLSLLQDEILECILALPTSQKASAITNALNIDLPLHKFFNLVLTKGVGVDNQTRLLVLSSELKKLSEPNSLSKFDYLIELGSKNSPLLDYYLLDHYLAEMSDLDLNNWLASTAGRPGTRLTNFNWLLGKLNMTSIDKFLPRVNFQNLARESNAYLHTSQRLYLQLAPLAYQRILDGDNLFEHPIVIRNLQDYVLAYIFNLRMPDKMLALTDALEVGHPLNVFFGAPENQASHFNKMKLEIELLKHAALFQSYLDCSTEFFIRHFMNDLCRFSDVELTQILNKFESVSLAAAINNPDYSHSIKDYIEELVNHYSEKNVLRIIGLVDPEKIATIIVPGFISKKMSDSIMEYIFTLSRDEQIQILTDICTDGTALNRFMAPINETVKYLQASLRKNIAAKLLFISAKAKISETDRHYVLHHLLDSLEFLTDTDLQALLHLINSSIVKVLDLPVIEKIFQVIQQEFSEKTLAQLNARWTIEDLREQHRIFIAKKINAIVADFSEAGKTFVLKYLLYAMPKLKGEEFIRVLFLLSADDLNDLIRHFDSDILAIIAECYGSSHAVYSAILSAFKDAGDDLFKCELVGYAIFLNDDKLVLEMVSRLDFDRFAEYSSIFDHGETNLLQNYSLSLLEKMCSREINPLSPIEFSKVIGAFHLLRLTLSSESIIASYDECLRNFIVNMDADALQTDSNESKFSLDVLPRLLDAGLEPQFLMLVNKLNLNDLCAWFTALDEGSCLINYKNTMTKLSKDARISFLSKIDFDNLSSLITHIIQSARSSEIGNFCNDIWLNEYDLCLLEVFAKSAFPKILDGSFQLAGFDIRHDLLRKYTLEVIATLPLQDQLHLLMLAQTEEFHLGKFFRGDVFSANIIQNKISELNIKLEHTQSQHDLHKIIFDYFKLFFSIASDDQDCMIINTLSLLKGYALENPSSQEAICLDLANNVSALEKNPQHKISLHTQTIAAITKNERLERFIETEFSAFYKTLSQYRILLGTRGYYRFNSIYSLIDDVGGKGGKPTHVSDAGYIGTACLNKRRL